MGEEKKHWTVAREVELLAVTAARIAGRPVLLLTVRPDPTGGFGAVNLALAKAQSDRLLGDLIRLYETSDYLKE